VYFRSTYLYICRRRTNKQHHLNHQRIQEFIVNSLFTSSSNRCYPSSAKVNGIPICQSPSIQEIPLFLALDPSVLHFEAVLKFNVELLTTALGNIAVPVPAYRPCSPGPVVGMACAIHGNEVNDIPIIQKLFNNISIPALNIPGFLDSIRCFDGQDQGEQRAGPHGS